MSIAYILSPEALRDALRRMDSAKVALIGDLCLDAYWYADMRLSELSRETPNFPLPVVSEKYSPGGAGNVACNLAALKPERLCVVGAVGADWRGDILLKCLRENGVDTSLILQSPDVVTNTYIKPMRSGISDVVYEDARIDFENRQPVSAEVEAQVLKSLETAAAQCDVICVSDQMVYGVVTEAVRERLCALGREGKTVIVDSRSRIGLYHNVIVKPNEVEASRELGVAVTSDMADAVEQLSRRNGAPAVITLGGDGCVVSDGGEAVRCAARRVEPPVDTVGAGDTFLSALGCALGGGSPLAEAASVANLASSVTVKKLHTTGTASRKEILRAAGLE